MFRLAADTLDYVHSFPAVIPDFDSKYSRKLVFNDRNDHHTSPSIAQDNARIIVFVHCHYPDLLKYFTAYLNRISDYDLIVTMSSPSLESSVSEWASRLKPNVNQSRRLFLRYFPNNGRDVRPFWEAGIALSSEYTVFLKLHTKSSPQYKGFIGLSWLKDILENLLTDASTVQQIATMIHSEEYGAVFPVPWRPFRYWGWTNRQNLYHSEEVCKALSIDPSILLNPLQYPVGNMYWGSTSILKAYGERILSSLSWPEEPLPLDGTLLHSLERITGYLYTAQRKKIAFSACSMSTARGQGIFSWNVEDLDNQHHETFYPVTNDENISSTRGYFSPASSLAFLSSGICSSMFAKQTMLPKTKLATLRSNILSYPRYVKRILLDDFIYLSAGHFSADSSIEAYTTEVHPFLNPESSILEKSKGTVLIKKIFILLRSITRVFTDERKRSRPK